MKILYSPVGDTDPIRYFRDGGVLHIIRHYQIDMAVLFLSAEMTVKENERHIYSKAINYIAPQCQIEFLKTDIKDVHRMESLTKMADEFIRLRKRYPEAEFYLNLSSGTPQMKNIIAFLANDFTDVTAIQVDSPINGSNRSNHAVQDNDDIETVIELNEDNDPSSVNRCHEAPLNLIRRYGIRYQIESLIDNYDYSGALKIYRRNKSLLNKSTEVYLEHAWYRERLMLKEAFKVLNNNLQQKREIQELNEFLMIMELQQKQERLSEFIIKLTPFLYQLVLFYLTVKLNVDINEICYNGNSKSKKLNNKKIKEIYPSIWKKLQNKFGEFRDGTDLAFSNMLIMIKEIDGADKNLINNLNKLRDIEVCYRNSVAHIITNITENYLKTTGPKMSSNDILNLLRNTFRLVTDGEIINERNVYTDINKKIKESMECF